MTQRPNGNVSLSSTDVLIAMLAHDLRGSWGQEGCPVRIREHVDPAASSPLPAAGEAAGAEDVEDPADLEDPEDPAR